MLTQWVVMVLNYNAPCHLQQCKCPDQDLWAPLYVHSGPELCKHHELCIEVGNPSIHVHVIHAVLYLVDAAGQAQQ